METLINPGWLDPAAHVAFLNSVFPGRWNRPTYDWYAARAFNGIHTDILVRCAGRRVLASFALCPRQIVVGTGAPIRVCVISAAATLGTERGRGHYAELLRAAVEHCRDRGCVALLGFVTQRNASGRGLLRMGALAVPSFYIVSGQGSRSGAVSRRQLRGLPTPTAAQRRSALEDAHAKHARYGADGCSGASTARFHYECDEDWRTQFIHRPNPIRAVRLAHDAVALLETVGDTDRLQWLGCPAARSAGHIAALAAASGAAGRKFFMYTLDPLEAGAAKRAGLRVHSGYLMLQSSGAAGERWHELARASWRVQSGDRL